MSQVVNISPVWNDAQFLDNAGVPLRGGKIYTRDGLGVDLPTYTTSAGDVANTNPIILDSNGRLSQSIWLIAGEAYTLTLATADDVVINEISNVITPRIIAGNNIEIAPASGVGAVTITALGGSSISSGSGNGLGQTYVWWADAQNPIYFDGGSQATWVGELKVPNPIPADPDVTWNFTGCSSVMTFHVDGSYNMVVNAEITPEDYGNVAVWPTGTTSFGLKVETPYPNPYTGPLDTSYHTRTVGYDDNLPQEFQTTTWQDNFVLSVTAGEEKTISICAFNPNSYYSQGTAAISVLVTRIGDQFELPSNDTQGNSAPK